MNLDQLRTFVTAADTLHFTQAGRLLGLSQPTISQQILDLETSLKAHLFERRGRQLVLTPAGERLRPLAQEVLTNVRRAEDALAEFTGDPMGVVRVGADSTPGTYLLPLALGTFTRENPGAPISVRETDREALLRAMKDGEMDVAVTASEPSAGLLIDWERVPLLTDEIVLIAPPHHRWANRTSVDVQELEGEPFILRQRDSSLRQLYSRRMAEVGFSADRLTVRFELSSTEGIKHAVMAGLGVGFVSRYSIDLERAAGRLVALRIRSLPIERQLWLWHPKDHMLGLYPQRFVETLLLCSDWLRSPLPC
ncbi:MAG TPA: LysR family transcriptional regulator [Stenomitos sp.]